MSTPLIISCDLAPVPGVRRAMTLVEVMLAVTVLAVGIGALVGQIAALSSLRRSSVADQEAQALLANFAERVSSADIAKLRTSALPWSYARPLPDDGANTWPGGSTWTVPEENWVRPLNISTDASKFDSRDGNSLVKQGLLKSNSALINPQVFIEYYRAMSWFDPDSTFNPSSLDSTKSDLRTRWPGIMRDTGNLGADGLGRPMYGLLCEANPFKPVTVADFSAIMSNANKRSIYYLKILPSAAVTGLDLNGVDHVYDSVMVRLTITWGCRRMLDMSSTSTVASTRGDWIQGQRLDFWTGIRSGKTD